MTRRVAFEEYGVPTGTPVFLLHGTPGGRLGGASMQPLFEHLGIRGISTDRPGYGGTEALPGRSVRDVAADVLSVADTLGLQQFHVIGGSGGGPHALGVGASSDRVLGVGVLVGAAPLADDELDGQVAFNREVLDLLDDEERLRKHLVSGRDLLLEHGIEALMPDAPDEDKAVRAAKADLLAATFADALAPGIEGWLDDYLALWQRPWGFAASEVAAPVVWAHGDHDLNVPIAAARRYAKDLPSCTFVEWTGVGHAPTPDLVISFFRDVLETHR